MVKVSIDPGSNKGHLGKDQVQHYNKLTSTMNQQKVVRDKFKVK